MQSESYFNVTLFGDFGEEELRVNELKPELHSEPR